MNREQLLKNIHTELKYRNCHFCAATVLNLMINKTDMGNEAITRGLKECVRELNLKRNRDLWMPVYRDDELILWHPDGLGGIQLGELV
ncbi:hypothetical protein IRP70_003978 [Salmonella enterica]|nr:hypothetical protein [Salmonella enterica]EGM2981983.1 hypothetical protein [Salmonella enterica]ELW6682928.1 hypothetical protein [Salmonella enterica]